MKMINEIKGFEEFEGYGITGCGKVWSFKTNKFLSPNKNYKGYLSVCLTNSNGYKKTVAIHRLVALAYIPNPNNYDTVDHIDENKEHNYINNLQWMTRGENKSKSWSKAVYCVELDRTFKSGAEAARELGLQTSKISNVCNGKRNKTGGYHFKFVES